ISSLKLGQQIRSRNLRVAEQTAPTGSVFSSQTQRDGNAARPDLPTETVDKPVELLCAHQDKPCAGEGRKKLPN
ncbi:MAG TPA: hypothetical protein PLD53_08785, partial [Candidatus Propionivibrio aalborgensis]|nr:hypothetical protein [Candidatus Propionivibrio aalborgensis]